MVKCSRLIPILVALLTLVLCSGWAIMYTNGGGNPFPATTPTPSLTAVTIDQCASGLLLSTQSGDLPLSLTVAKSPDGTPEGMVLIHKGVTTGTDPNQNFLSSMDTFSNVWYNDIAQTHGVNKDSTGCLNVDWVPISNSTGSDVVTAKSPGTGLFNAAVLCTVKNFAAYDVSSGTPYTAAANALTGTVSPTVSTDLLAGLYYIEATSPAFTNSSTNSTVAMGTPVDLGFTTSSTSSNASQLVGAVDEAGSVNTSLGFQRGFTPSGNFCGGIIALTNTISSVTVSPPNPTIAAGGTQQFTATAVLPSGGTQNVLTGGPTWTSSNTAVATISATGLATVSSSAAVNSMATITARYKGTTATATITVIAATTGVFPQFNTTGQVTTSFNAATSLFPRSWFSTNVFNNPEQPLLTDNQNAAVNLTEFSAYYDPGATGCAQASWALFGGTGNCGTWDNAWAVTGAVNFNGVSWNSMVSKFNSDHLPFMILTGTDCNYDNYTDICTSPMAEQFISDYNGALNGTGFSSGGFTSAATPAPSNMVVYQLGPDEGGCGGVGAPNACTLTALNLWGVGTTNTHRVYGQEPQNATLNGWHTSAAADFIDWEVGGGTVSFPNPAMQTGIFLKGALVADNNRSTLNRPTIPTMMTTFEAGPYYFKGASGANNYTPGVDCDSSFGITTDGGGNGTSIGLTLDQLWFAVAHGYQGYRMYQFDQSKNSRISASNVCTGMPTTGGVGSGTCGNGTPACDCYANTPLGKCQLLQTGSSPITEFTSQGAIGQDRWVATSVTNNLIKQLEPYILQPVLAAPDTAPGATSACLTFTNTDVNTGDNVIPLGGVVCGAKGGTAGKVVVLVNYSDSAHSFVYDPSIYWFGTGSTAQSWIMDGAMEQSNGESHCGPQFYNGSANDCGIGPTCFGTETTAPTTSACGTGGTAVAYPGNVFPAGTPGNAPIAVTTLNMQPGEVDVFLYHP